MVIRPNSKFTIKICLSVIVQWHPVIAKYCLLVRLLYIHQSVTIKYVFKDNGTHLSLVKTEGCDIYKMHPGYCLYSIPSIVMILIITIYHFFIFFFFLMVLRFLFGQWPRSDWDQTSVLRWKCEGFHLVGDWSQAEARLLSLSRNI